MLKAPLRVMYGKYSTRGGIEVIVKPHHEEDIFIITQGRGVNNNDILQMQVGLSGFYPSMVFMP